MIGIIIGLLTRIFSNSYLNVFQKLLTNKGEYSSVINFYTYLGLSLIGLLFHTNYIITTDLLINISIMGLLGALGNFFIIKALSKGDLSTLAPINSYKPIIALFLGICLINEIPSNTDILGITLIITGTFILNNKKTFFTKAIIYRFLALMFSGTEAIFIKKVILLSDIQTAFTFWAISGLIFSTLFVLFAKHKFFIKKENIKNQLTLIALVALMQYSTNYLFTKMNVAHALALFQLSTVVSIFLGVNIFKEKDLFIKLLAGITMLLGAVVLILF